MLAIGQPLIKMMGILSTVTELSPEPTHANLVALSRYTLPGPGCNESGARRKRGNHLPPYSRSVAPRMGTELLPVEAFVL